MSMNNALMTNYQQQTVEKQRDHFVVKKWIELKDK